ncbi:histidine kinase [Streptomyces sp. NPDC047515]|uniref:sensor histidine kinase n=1 Tax=Streptomyces sp. NPDC047515 TaxID=3155380 RepID=UPI00340B2A81
MSNRYLPHLRVLSGLLFLGVAAAAWTTGPATGVTIVAVGLLTAGTALAAATHLPRRPSVRRWLGLTAAAASAAVTACYQGPVVNSTGWWWALETLALLALMVPTARRTSGRVGAIAYTSVQGAAIAVLPLRIGLRLTPPAGPAETGVLCLLWSLLAVGAAALGGYLRVQDSRRRRALAEQRREQRLEVAGDLHDFASHDVMGVVVLVQAARLLARDDPARAVELLPRIEEAGLQALAAMDRTVWTLNADTDTDTDTDTDADRGRGRAGDAAVPGGAPAGRPPGADRSDRSRDRRRDLSELPELAARFTRTGTVPVHLDVTGGALDGLPGEVSATGYRIVVESLTNVRRHASAAAVVDIAARRVPYRAGTALRLTVTDTTGAEAAPRTSLRRDRARGGLGLTGLTERTEALGGSLTAGPHGTAGWQVTATLPLHGSAPPTAAPHERTSPARRAAPEETVA